ncbi:hypothetical protein E3P99_04046 [Wallemia hederae]|uniref:2,5-diamino-6-ribosylamino-4(3H)-pyrimidinone 5'-phosphate reductase n=1 Tax=Wallemia hederae TaxID=1540922 RepID=A0A4T0FB64_9BASI|nr:hypothetical protein E3P99_04046 [Wallemia hederae]
MNVESKEWLERNLQSNKSVQIILTYAQSIDGCIAGRDKQQLLLSGKQSMEMTHALRSISDAIVVGIGTVLNEDPGLNARIPTLAPLNDQPTPIIIDPHLRTPLTAKVISNYTKGVGKAPIVLTSVERCNEDKRQALEGAGVRVEQILQGDGQWRREYFTHLSHVYSFKRVMIEGGATVIKGLLSSDGVVDELVVTVSPVLIGSAGLSIISDKVPSLRHKDSRVFGKDVVFIASTQ